MNPIHISLSFYILFNRVQLRVTVCTLIYLCKLCSVYNSARRQISLKHVQNDSETPLIFSNLWLVDFPYYHLQTKSQHSFIPFIFLASSLQTRGGLRHSHAGAVAPVKLQCASKKFNKNCESILKIHIKIHSLPQKPNYLLKFASLKQKSMVRHCSKPTQTSQEKHSSLAIIIFPKQPIHLLAPATQPSTAHLPEF